MKNIFFPEENISNILELFWFKTTICTLFQLTPSLSEKEIKGLPKCNEKAQKKKEELT